jgi:hypothetical protein
MARTFLNVNSALLGTSKNVVIATTSTAVASSAFDSTTYQVRIASPAACYYKVGDATPTATTTDVYLPANTIEYVSVRPGQMVSVFSATTQTISVAQVTQ